jgi:hypothetical protein
VVHHKVKNQTIVFPATPALKVLLPLAAINREYSTAEVVRLRAHLLKIGELFAKDFPYIKLIPASPDTKGRRKARRAAKKATAKARASSSKRRPS